MNETRAVRLMAGRTGYISAPNFEPGSQQGVNIMANDLQYHGGNPQQNRMIRDKRKALDKAVLYSYQGAFVKKVFNEDFVTIYDELDQPPVRALINPNKLKQDYDDKIISIGYEHHYQTGDVFEWCNTDTKWLIYLQDLTELAYFRGDIRRCRYEIEWLDEEGNKHSTFAAVRGPVETKINYIQKVGISVDTPNHSLNILMPLTEASKKYFKRYSKFYLQDDTVCWRVEAIDWISMPNILEVVAVEYYANETEDDIDKGLVGSLIVKDLNVNTPRIERLIDGDTFIKPKRSYTYTYTGLNDDGEWEFDKKLPIEYHIDGKSITITWTASYSGQFVLKYRNLEKTIVIESLF